MLHYAKLPNSDNEPRVPRTIGHSDDEFVTIKFY